VTTTLEVTEGGLRTHWNLLQAELGKIRTAGLPRVLIVSNFVSDQAIAAMSGPEVETTERHRGGRVEALPININGRASGFWVSYREQWKASSGRRFRYSSADLTFFQGQPGDEKRQLFRAEWPGFADWGGGSPGWQAPGAGHPHWQFDALRSYVSAEVRRAEAAELLAMVQRPANQLEEFGEQDLATASELMVETGPDIRWTGMHFANQARWSKQAWHGDTAEVSTHTSAPATSKEIRDWAVSVLAYARHELGRAGSARS
jgi:hypothetical protein